jgi:hypothetical protein
MFNSVRFQTDSDLGQGIYWKPANDGTTLRVYGSTYSAGIGYLQLNVQSGADGLVVNGGARTLLINAAQTSIALNLNNITFNTHGTGEAMRIVNTTKNVLIGTTTDAGYKLDVRNGTALIHRGIFGLSSTGGQSLRVVASTGGVDNVFSVHNEGSSIQYFGITSNTGLTTFNSNWNIGSRLAADTQSLFIMTDQATAAISTLTVRGGNATASNRGGGNLILSSGASAGSGDGINGYISFNITNVTASTGVTNSTSEVARFSLGKNLLIGTTTDLAKLTVRGSGSTSATTSLLVQNSNGLANLQITDDGQVSVNNEGKFSVVRYGNTLLSTGQSTSSLSTYNSSVTVTNTYVAFNTLGNFGWAFLQDLFQGYHPMIIQDATFKARESSALVELNSKTRGFLKPKMTTAQKNAIVTPTAGLEVYDSTTNTPNYFNGTTWVGVASNQSTGLSPGLFSQTSDSVAVTNTTVESSLISTGVGTLSVPANGFQVGAAYIAYLSGVMSSQNNATMEIHLRSNGFVLADTDPMILSATTGKFWELHVNFVIRAIGGGGVAAIVTSGRFSYNKDSGNIPESIGFSDVNNTTFDTTINNTLTVTATWGNASPSNSIQTRIFNLYRVY